MRIFLEPTESLLFRTGRPFDAGESGYAESIFPPTPETLQGAIRATIATHWDPTKTLEELFQDQDLIDRIGVRKSYGRFRITSIALGRRKKDNEHEIDRLFPPPAHLLKDEEGTILLLRPQPMDSVKSIMQEKADDGTINTVPYNMQYLIPDPTRKTKGKLKPITEWLTEESLYQVLQATLDLSKLEIVSLHDIFVREPRIGIGMQNATKTTQEGLLYQVHMIRMCPNYGFVLDVRLSTEPDNNNFIDDAQTQKELRMPSKGWITLGGERRAARFEVIAPSTYEQGVSVEGSKKGTLLYIATPTYFEGGWQPTLWPNSINPIAAVVDRYKSIGGWLLGTGNSGGTQKIVHRCVPEGSVYFFDQSISQPLTNFGSHIGYGIAYAGEWK
jgi:CRISPR-associated protein Cmr3